MHDLFSLYHFVILGSVTNLVQRENYFRNMMIQLQMRLILIFHQDIIYFHFGCVCSAVVGLTDILDICYRG